MEKCIICAGFGGQGVLTAGMLLASVAYENGRQITWFPSYGAEMRGGTANCTVKISDRRIGSPMAGAVDIALTMNEPAIDKFEGQIAPGGCLLVNTTVVDEERKYRDDISVVRLKAGDMAAAIGNDRGANLVMLGGLLRHCGLFEIDVFNQGMCDYFSSKGKGKFNQKNTEALMSGYGDG